MRCKVEIFCISATALACSLTSGAEQATSHKPFNLVMPTGPGRIVVPAASTQLEWKAPMLYDNGIRPVFHLTDHKDGLEVSYVLFPNTTGSSSPKVCRDDVLRAAESSLSAVPGVTHIKDAKHAEEPGRDGQLLATGSSLVESVGEVKVRQQNLFGVYASATACAEIHISKTGYGEGDDPTMSAQLASFQFERAYVPAMIDYYTLGSVFYQVTKSFGSAAFYYQRALDTLPADAPLNFRRVIVDQLSIAYGTIGQLKRSRTINETAVVTDPDYPIYYYNLACTDAEEGDATKARTHLQQAFDRKDNVLPGEHLPDPAQDSSLQKLKKNKEFWGFVTTLK